MHIYVVGYVGAFVDAETLSGFLHWVGASFFLSGLLRVFFSSFLLMSKYVKFYWLWVEVAVG